MIIGCAMLNQQVSASWEARDITYLVVSSSIVSDQSILPECVDSESAKDNVSIPGLMVMANPSSDESPEGFHSWISSDSGNLLWLTTWIIEKRES